MFNRVRVDRSRERIERILYLLFFISFFLPWCQQLPEVSGTPLNGFVFVMFLIMNGMAWPVGIAFAGALLLAAGNLLSGGRDEGVRRQRRWILYLLTGAVLAALVLVMIQLIEADNSVYTAFMLLLANLGMGAYAIVIVAVGLWLLSKKHV